MSVKDLIKIIKYYDFLCLETDYVSDLYQRVGYLIEKRNKRTFSYIDREDFSKIIEYYPILHCYDQHRYREISKCLEEKIKKNVHAYMTPIFYHCCRGKSICVREKYYINPYTNTYADCVINGNVRMVKFFCDIKSKYVGCIYHDALRSNNIIMVKYIFGNSEIFGKCYFSEIYAKIIAENQNIEIFKYIIEMFWDFADLIFDEYCEKIPYDGKFL